MKILHLIESGGLYGAERIVLDLAAAQMRRGDQPTILSLGTPNQSDKAIETAARVRGIVVRAWRMKSGLNLWGMRRVVGWARSEQIEIFHCHGYRMDTLMALADPLRRCSRVSTVHGFTQNPDGSLRLSQRLGLRCLATMHKAVFVSEQTRLAVGKSMRNGIVIPNGIETKPFRDIRQQPATKSAERINILAVGRLAAEKNYSLLLDTLAELNGRSVPCHLTLCGEGPLEAELKQHVDRLSLSNVDLPGYSTNIPQLLHAADVLVFTSRTEGMPVTVIEAMLLGVPVVSTAVGGIPAMLAGYSVGRVTTEHTAESIASLITDVCDPASVVRASAQEVAEIETRHSAESMAASYRSMYESVIGVSSD